MLLPTRKAVWSKQAISVSSISANNFNKSKTELIHVNNRDDQNYIVFIYNPGFSFADVCREAESKITNANKVVGAGLILTFVVTSVGGVDKHYVLTIRRNVGWEVSSIDSLATNPNAKFQVDSTLGGGSSTIFNYNKSYIECIKENAKGKIEFLLGNTELFNDERSNLSIKLKSYIESSDMEPYVCSHSCTWSKPTEEYNGMYYLTSIVKVSIAVSELEELDRLCNKSNIFSMVELKPLIKSAQATYRLPERNKLKLPGLVSFNDISLNAFATAEGTSIYKLIHEKNIHRHPLNFNLSGYFLV